MNLDARRVSLDSLLDVALRAVPVTLAATPAWRRRIERSRAGLERMLRDGTCVYGVSTGVGNSSSHTVDRDGQVAYGRSVMEQHGCGFGEPFPETEARAIVFARLVALAKGLSGVRLSLLEALSQLLNHGIAPVIPRFGSVGASGDLTPLSYVAAAVAGEREVFHRGRVVPAAEALRAEGLRPFDFAPKETLSIMNGTSVMTAVGILATARFEAVIETAERASALAVEMLLGRSQAFDPRIHAAKPHPGQVESARRIERALAGSRLVDPPSTDGRTVQDRYSLRCSPQALGAARDAATWANGLLAIELNSANDNPLVDARRGEALFGGNFFGGHPALAMDLVKVAAASVADLVDRQFALLVDRHNSLGLPDTLVAYDGCGVKGLQMTCSALTALAIQRSAPDSVLSRSTECGNQDKVSMGLNAAVNAREAVEYVAGALAAELVALSNAAVHRDERRVSPAGRQLLGEIRAISPVLSEDRRLDIDVARLAAWIGRRPARA
ncbi:MAG: aromatic amino acid lyase [Acidobacteria bacterium]|nr:aromatic amino acid lyase [Acidobacteriota bacterium]